MISKDDNIHVGIVYLFDNTEKTAGARRFIRIDKAIKKLQKKIGEKRNQRTQVAQEPFSLEQQRKKKSIQKEIHSMENRLIDDLMPARSKASVKYQRRIFGAPAVHLDERGRIQREFGAEGLDIAQRESALRGADYMSRIGRKIDIESVDRARDAIAAVKAKKLPKGFNKLRKSNREVMRKELRRMGNPFANL